MDFNDTPQEAEFRAEANRWLSQNAKPRSESGNMMSVPPRRIASLMPMKALVNASPSEVARKSET